MSRTLQDLKPTAPSNGRRGLFLPVLRGHLRRRDPSIHPVRLSDRSLSTSGEGSTDTVCRPVPRELDPLLGLRLPPILSDLVREPVVKFDPSMFLYVPGPSLLHRRTPHKNRHSVLDKTPGLVIFASVTHYDDQTSLSADTLTTPGPSQSYVFETSQTPLIVSRPVSSQGVLVVSHKSCRTPPRLQGGMSGNIPLRS